MTRARAAARNSFFGFAAYLYPLILTIAVTPVLVHRLGVEQYGIFVLASTFGSFLGLLDLGMGTAAIRYGAYYLARGSERELDSVLGSNLVFFGIVGGLGFGATCLFALFGVEYFVSAEHLSVARFAFVGGGIALWITMLANVWSSIPAIVQRFDVRALVLFVASSIGATLSVSVVLAGYGLRGLIVVTVIQSIVSLALFVLVKPRLLPAVRIRPRAPAAMLRKMFAFSGYAFASNVSGLIVVQLGRFVLGGFRGTSAVTFYSVPGSIAQRLHGGIAQLTAVLMPASSSLFAQGESAALKILYARATRLVLLVALSIVVPTFVFAGKILDVWLGSSFEAKSTMPFRLLLITYFVLALSTIPYYLTFGIDRPKIAAVFSGISAIFNVALVFALTPRFGINGTAVGYLISTLPMLLWVQWMERELRVGSGIWLRMLVRVLPCALIQAGVALAFLPLAANLGLTVLLVVTSILIAPLIYVMTPIGPAEDIRLLREMLPARLAAFVPAR